MTAILYIGAMAGRTGMHLRMTDYTMSKCFARNIAGRWRGGGNVTERTVLLQSQKPTSDKIGTKILTDHSHSPTIITHHGAQYTTRPVRDG